ncbi:formate dehydrogenase family accessory protein FdhD [Candidatus Bathyarchaeota archaeon RBG_13_60_20]|nr:MAG: formate dehydrogenase family accessory protein FdhD [Candidatus Bathyarchaeota archaeon RBG_13_60_20]
MVTEKRRIQTIDLGPTRKRGETLDELALDEPLCVFVNGEYHVTLIATPEMRRELAVGYLLSGGVISSVDDIASIETRGSDIMVEMRSRVDLRGAMVDMMNLIVTACSASPRPRGDAPRLPRVDSGMRVGADTLKTVMAELNRRSSVHMRTRGTHAAMLCSVDGETLAFAEDVGRHNALDKVVGAYALEGGDPGGCVLLSTGRQSGEMVQKAARAGVPVVCSMTVPLISGIRLAEAAGVTLASLSAGRLKVYTCPERIE